MIEPSTGGTGSRSAAERCRAPMSARRREDKTSEQLLVLMPDGDDGTTSMIQVERLAEFVVRDSYEDLSEEAIREVEMRILDTLRCAIGAPARDFKARDPGHQGSLGQDPDLQGLDREVVVPSAFPDGFSGQCGYCGVNVKEV
jgi:hypothetical protein